MTLPCFVEGQVIATHYVRDVAVGQDHGHGPLASIARIGAQVLGAALLWRRTLDQDGIEHGLNLRHVVCVGSRHDER